MTTIQDDGVPCTIKGGIWRELARQTAKDRKAVLRELVSNAIDAINKRVSELPQEEVNLFKKRIEIIYRKDGGIWCIDNGTGIRDLDTFMEIAKKSYKDDVIETEYDMDDRIGNFHVGKLSFVIISETECVEFESVDKNEIGMKTNLYPDEEDILKHKKPEYLKADKIMSHTGLIVKIKQVKKKFIMPLEKAKEYLGEVFAPWIAFGLFQIVIHHEDGPEEEIMPPVEFDRNVETLDTLSDGTKIYGNVKKAKDAGKIFVYKNGVLIQRDLDFRKKMAPFSYVIINTRGIKTNFARDSFQTDLDDSPLWDEFVETIAEILENRGFEDSERPKRAAINNGKQVVNCALQSLKAIISLSPYDTPPEFDLDLVGNLKIRQPTKETKKIKIKTTVKRLTSKRKKRGKGKGNKSQSKNDPEKKYEKHKHYQDEERNKDEGSQDGNQAPKIKYFKDDFKNNHLVFFDRKASALCINENRTMCEKLFNSPILSKGAQNEITRAMLRAMPENEKISVEEFEKKYYAAIDQRELMA